MNITKYIAMCAFLGMVAFGNAARADDSGSGEGKEGASLWYKGNRIELRTSDESRKFEGSFIFGISDGGDVHLVTRETRAGKTTEGEILMLFSGVMLARGIEIDPEWAVSALDGPALATQLALKLLHLAFPNGPMSVGAKGAIGLKETERSVTVSTPTSDGMLVAPWTVEGTASRQTGERVEFDMVAYARRASGGDGPVVLPMSGSWNRLADAPALQDSMPLDGWRVYEAAPLRGPIQGERALVSGEMATDAGIRTLGALREAIAMLSK